MHLPCPWPGCVTSLLGLLFSFALSENSSAAPPPKRAASEAGTPAEGSVSGRAGRTAGTRVQRQEVVQSLYSSG